MGEHTLQPNGSIARGTGRDGPIQSAQAVPKTHEAILKYVNKAVVFLSKLGEWEIEFKTIKAETPHAFHIHFAALKIEYHFLTLIYVTHSSHRLLRRPHHPNLRQNKGLNLELERNWEQSSPPYS
ncbi:hypothetical protein M422DRAFT_39432 [Sphaerobolus stellatus SS14]|uniref:Uncharacterized protein n=1 Tax=Sphaerobolus stellatus (strain SS14) TaxID=990650 RepID=A0A0C9UEC9_SPHS4|nr:hypothetical protein M422DRAFT_39432 [Sphaerobolus stellatus SS14]